MSAVNGSITETANGVRRITVYYSLDGKTQMKETITAPDSLSEEEAAVSLAREKGSSYFPFYGPAEAAPVRVQLSRAAGWRMPENTVNVARPGPWGNPFRVTETLTAAKAVAAFACWLETDGVDCGIQGRKQWMLANLKRLRGKNLACWCKPGTPCHADVLLKLANAGGN